MSRAFSFLVGCIFAEMMTRRPLFPGDSEIDQLFRIFRYFWLIQPPKLVTTLLLFYQLHGNSHRRILVFLWLFVLDCLPCVTLICLRPGVSSYPDFKPTFPQWKVPADSLGKVDIS